MEKEKKIRCSRCNEYMNETDSVCPNCGFDYGDDSPIPVSSKKDKNSDNESLNSVQIMAIIYAILGILGVIIVSSELKELGINSTTITIVALITIVFSTVCLYGFGTIIENTNVMKSTLNDIKNRLDSNKK